MGTEYYSPNSYFFKFLFNNVFTSDNGVLDTSLIAASFSSEHQHVHMRISDRVLSWRVGVLAKFEGEPAMEGV